MPVHIIGGERHNKMIYNEPAPIERECAINALNSKTEDLIIDALLRLTLHDSDSQWVQNICIKFSAHENVPVRRTAIQCLGHLARIHRKLDLSIVQPVLASLHGDPEIAGVVEDTLDDIEVYLGSDL